MKKFKIEVLLRAYKSFKEGTLEEPIVAPGVALDLIRATASAQGIDIEAEISKRDKLESLKKEVGQKSLADILADEAKRVMQTQKKSDFESVNLQKVLRKHFVSQYGD